MSKKYQVEDVKKLKTEVLNKKISLKWFWSWRMTTPVIFSLSSIPPFTDRRGGGDTLERQMYYEKCISSIL